MPLAPMLKLSISTLSLLSASAAAWPSRRQASPIYSNSTLRIKPANIINATAPAGSPHALQSGASAFLETALAPPPNIINATVPAGPPRVPQDGASAHLKTAIVNYLDSEVNAYIAGLNSDGQLVFIGPDGKMTFPYTTSSTPELIEPSTISVPVGPNATSHITLPGYICSARVWLSEGELQFFMLRNPNGAISLVTPSAVDPDDPNAQTNWGFSELDWSQKKLYADNSFVDFVGLPMGIKLNTTDEEPEQQALGLPSDAVKSICKELKAEAELDEQPWDQGCMQVPYNGSYIRVLSPNSIVSVDSEAFGGFFEDYVQEVFEKYSAEPLTINRQNKSNPVECRTDPASMTLSCDGDDCVYPAPSTADIFGCSTGPFEIGVGASALQMDVVPILCAALNRGTLLLDQAKNVTIKNHGVASGSIQPGLMPKSYYSDPRGVHNKYSAAVHKLQWEGKGYAFSYDDVYPVKDQDVAGVVSSSEPDTLTIMVGGYDLDPDYEKKPDSDSVDDEA